MGGCHASITGEKSIVNSFPRGKSHHETTIIINIARPENDSREEEEEEKQNYSFYTQRRSKRQSVCQTASSLPPSRATHQCLENLTLLL